jgi:hypothetical protein
LKHAGLSVIKLIFNVNTQRRLLRTALWHYSVELPEFSAGNGMARENVADFEKKAYRHPPPKNPDNSA